MTKLETEVLDAATDAATDARNRAKRKKWLIILGSTVLSNAVSYGIYSHYYGSKFISTDNAYTAAENAQITPAISGIVREVRVSDTQQVKQGDVIVILDDTDARLAVAQAEAELGRAMRRVRGYVANDASLAAQLLAAKADLQRAKVDLERREVLASSGSVSGDELTKARNAFANAQASVAAALGSRDANAALIADTTEATNPEVELARARRDQALVNLERTVIRASTAGVIARRTVQVGQQVQSGSPLLWIVPLQQVHVDANFKEVQLERVRIGQPVEVHSDLYGRSVTYRGTVAGLAGGTGSTFATIPAQNATGNWIKVVQRVPVRIELDAQELAARPLQVGLSMTATIDTRSDG
ncbi:MAG TPA: HlyD family secretion protein [Steroidobacteraceae bacterium]|nr:HlyD family secretion protein [Steroidobacteraceae bacterium]